MKPYLKTIWIAAAAISALSSARAGADEANGEPGEWRVLRHEGRECYRRRDYACALERFEKALALRSTTGMRFNVASALDKLGRAAEAVAQYWQYQDEAGSSAPVQAQAHMAERLPLLYQQVARVTFLNAPTTATLAVNGHASPLHIRPGAEQRGAERIAVLPPGESRLLLQAPEHEARTWTIELQAGEQRHLQSALAPREQDAAEAEPAGSEATKPLPPLPPPVHHPPDNHTLGTVMLATGSVAATTAAILYSVALLKGGLAHSEYEQTRSSQEREEARANIEAAEDLLVAGHLTSGLAVITLGIGIFDLIHKGKVSEPRERSWSVAAHPAGAAVSMKGRF